MLLKNVGYVFVSILIAAVVGVAAFQRLTGAKLLAFGQPVGIGIDVFRYAASNPTFLLIVFGAFALSLGLFRLYA